MHSSTYTKPSEYHGRLLFLAMVILGAFGLLLWRMWQIQILDNALYTSRLPSNYEVRVRIPPIRGEIRDRNGVLLAQNRSAFAIEFYLPQMVRAYRDRYGSVPMISYVGRVHDMAKVMKEPDIIEIVNTAVIPRLRQLGLPTAYDHDDLVRHFRIDTEVPYPFVENADFATIARFSEHDIGLPGVRITLRPFRHYLYGALAAHVLGYVGDPQEIATLSDAREFQFYDPNVEGKAQVELSMDKYLRGTAGTRVMQRNLKGVIDKEVSVEPPEQGKTVFLTLDTRIQFIAERNLRAVGRAGAVVVDPNNGDILALASVPSYDPNAFIPSVSPDAWKRLLKDPTDPLVNRAISAYPPGSTFKLVTALAGLRRGLAKNAFTCTGGVSYGDHYFQCWNSHGHGRLTVSDAITVSCNAFFYQYGNAAGIESIDAVGNLLGLGQSSNLGLTTEQPGILPSPEWLKVHSPTERWSSAQTANVSIGQGYDLVSPLQLVMAYSAVANGGTSYYPNIIKQVTNVDGSPMRDSPSDLPIGPRIRGQFSDVNIMPEELELVRKGFWKVVNDDSGTARRARLDGGIVAGKTGTAQAQSHGHQDTIAWFVCFAPFDKPRYAVAVMVQGGAHGGSVAAPIAARILEETLAMDEGAEQPLMAALSPARHRDPFRMIESLDLDKELGTANSPAGTTGLEPVAQKPGADARKVRVDVQKGKLVSGAHTASEPPAAHQGFFQWLFHPRGR